VNPRQGKFGRLLPALSLFLAYYILLIVGTNMLQSGKLPLALGLWWAHVLVLLLAIVLLVQSRAGAQRLKARIFGRGEHA
jgi:lipopolysaccharide export system permease protein